MSYAFSEAQLWNACPANFRWQLACRIGHNNLMLDQTWGLAVFVFSFLGWGLLFIWQICFPFPSIDKLLDEWLAVFAFAIALISGVSYYTCCRLLPLTKSALCLYLYFESSSLFTLFDWVLFCCPTCLIPWISCFPSCLIWYASMAIDKVYLLAYATSCVIFCYGSSRSLSFEKSRW